MAEIEGVTLPDQFLQDFGCRGCVWKQYDRCPKGYTKVEEKTRKGFCEEMAQFLFSLRAQSKTLNETREKVLLYIQGQESMADRMRYHELRQKYEVMKNDEKASRSELGELKMAVESYKLWWDRLNTNVIKGHSRISDRDARKEDKKAIATHVTIQQFNVWMKEALLEAPEEKDGTMQADNQ